jgi:sulfite reductase (NADPH) hemoprotein beta-component
MAALRGGGPVAAKVALGAGTRAAAASLGKTSARFVPGLNVAIAALDTANAASGLALNAMSCVALPTCGLALAESERYLPELVKLLETEIEAAGLRDDAITLRITGCPNGCGRPYLAEIGFVGRAPGKYNIYLGAAFNGSRFNTLFRPNVPVAEIVPLLGPIIRRYALERTAGERFGDFTLRTGIVNHTGTPADFHEASKVAPAVSPTTA